MGILKALVYSLWAQDVPAAARFYRDVIGLDLLPDHSQHPVFDLGHGSHLVILQGQRPSAQRIGHGRFPHIAFAVEDLDDAIAHLETCGVELPWGIEANREARWILFRDPAGNWIELAQLNRK